MAIKRIEVPVRWETQGDEDAPPNVYWVSDKHDGPHSGNFTSKEQALAYEKYKGKPDQIPGLAQAADAAATSNELQGTPVIDTETGQTSWQTYDWVQVTDPAKRQEYIDRAMNSPLDWVGQNINWSGIGHGGDFSALDKQVQFLKDNKYDTSTLDKNALNQYNLTKQILAQGTTGKWSGQGFGSPIENAKQMARVLSTAGIEDIKDFGKIKKDNFQDVGVAPEYTGDEYGSTPTGRYYYADPETGARQFFDAKDVTFQTTYDPEGGTSMIPVAKANVGGMEVWGNKKTQQGITEDYGGSGNYFSGTFAGHGRTNYGVQFAADGMPYFYSQFGGDTSSMGDIVPLVSIGLSIFAPGIGTAIGTALGATGVAATVLGGAIVSGVMAEAAGGDFLEGAIKGAITAGVAPTVAQGIGSTVTDAMGDSVFKNVIINSLTNSATSVITAAMNGSDDLGAAALNGALTGAASAVGQDVGVAVNYGTDPFSQQTETLLAQDRGLSSAGRTGGALGVAGLNIARGADPEQVLTGVLTNAAVDAIQSMPKTGTSSADTNLPERLSDATQTDATVAGGLPVDTTDAVTVPGAENVANLTGGQGVDVAGPMTAVGALPYTLERLPKDFPIPAGYRVLSNEEMFGSPREMRDAGIDVRYSDAIDGREALIVPDSVGKITLEDGQLHIATTTPLQAVDQGPSAITSGGAADDDAITTLGGESNVDTSLVGADGDFSLDLSGNDAVAGGSTTTGGGGLPVDLSDTPITTGGGTSSGGTSGGNGGGLPVDLGTGTGTGTGTGADTVVGGGTGADTVTGGGGSINGGGNLGGGNLGGNNTDADTATRTVTRIPTSSSTDTTQGALPVALSPSLLQAAPVTEGVPLAMQDLPQLFPQLTNIDPRLMQVLSGRNAKPGYYNYGQQVNAQSPLMGASISGLPSAGIPVRATSNAYSPLSAGVASGNPRDLMQAGLSMLGGGGGGLSGYAQGGEVEGHNPQFITGKTGYYVRGEGDGQSDSIPAMLADGEYVFDADTVAALGNGSNEAGARVLDKMRENIRKHKRSAKHGEIPPPAKSPLAYMKG